MNLYILTGVKIYFKLTEQKSQPVSNISLVKVTCALRPIKHKTLKHGPVDAESDPRMDDYQGPILVSSSSFYVSVK